MGRIVGVVCDACGAADIEVSDSHSAYLLEDKFPRNNWLSITQWINEGEADSPDIHICSPECLLSFAQKFLEQDSGESHEHS